MGDSPPPDAQHAMGSITPCPDPRSWIPANPGGSDYLDGKDVYHHWLSPLMPSLADRWRGAQAGETSASVLSPAAHAGSLLSREVRSAEAKKNP